MTEYNKDDWPEEFTDLSIEKVEKYGDDGSDRAFFTELRVLSGPQKGQLKRNLWFRTKRDGNLRKDTTSLLTALTGNPEAPSYELMGKIFKTKPWYPDGSNFPIFTRIEKVGEVTDGLDEW